MKVSKRKKSQSDRSTPDEAGHAWLISMTTLPDIETFLDTLDRMVTTVVARGFTDEQARAIVAHRFGYRPVDGAAP